MLEEPADEAVALALEDEVEGRVLERAHWLRREMLAASDERRPRIMGADLPDELASGEPVLGEHEAETDHVRVLETLEDLRVRDAPPQENPLLVHWREAVERLARRVDDGHLVPRLAQARGHVGGADRRDRGGRRDVLRERLGAADERALHVRFPRSESASPRARCSTSSWHVASGERTGAIAASHVAIRSPAEQPYLTRLHPSHCRNPLSRLAFGTPGSHFSTTALIGPSRGFDRVRTVPFARAECHAPEAPPSVRAGAAAGAGVSAM